MTDHTLFYYPYASFTNAQLPLLKLAALYFDKLYLLDPVGASWDTVGAETTAREAVKQLQDAGILEVVTPAAVLAKYEGPITEAIRRDMGDDDFMGLCDAHGRATGKRQWTLSLAKVPKDLQTDQIMRQLMGDFAREMAGTAAYATQMYVERVVSVSDPPDSNSSESQNLDRRADDYLEYAETGHAFDEFREGYGDMVEYRYADFPLALGEAIMMNHALFAGFLHADATPITDEPFHNSALALKLRRAAQEPVIQDAVFDRARSRQLKGDRLVATALTDAQLSLPALNPEVPLDEVLEYSQMHDLDLQQVRDKLGWMARRIEAEPWSEAFAEELEHKTIPDIAKELEGARRARDDWLGSQRGRRVLTAAGLAVGAAAAVLAVFTAPVTPIALATAGLGLVSGTVIPGAEWLLDWRDGKKSLQENGLHYLLRT